MDAGEPDALGSAVDDDVDMAGLADRQLVLADLIALAEIGVEVVLARPAAHRGDATVGGEPGPHRELDDAAIEHRQHAGHAEADRTGVVVGGSAEGGRAATEDFRRRQQLGVHLEPDDALVVAEPH